MVASLSLLEKSVVVETQITRLKVALSRASLGRNDFAVRNRQDHPIDVGQLIPLLVYPVIVWVSLKHEAVGRWSRLQYPRFKRRQIWVVVSVHRIQFIVERRPIALLRLSHQNVKGSFLGIFL